MICVGRARRFKGKTQRSYASRWSICLPNPPSASRLFLTFVMSLSVTIGYWGVSSFVPSYVGSVATAAGLPPSAGWPWPAWCKISAPCSASSASASLPMRSAASRRRCCFI